jgi:hypothetical protein
MKTDPRERRDPDEEARRLAGEKSPGVAREFLSMMMENKKWWLLPALLVLLAVGALVVLAGSGAAPFLYALF